MTGDLSTQPSKSSPIAPVAEHPVAVYLAGLSEGSRRTMLGSLNAIAKMASNDALDADGFPWSQLRPEHTAAVRARLIVQYSASTANKMLAALRGVLKACWRLGLIDSEQYHRARDVGSVRGSSLPKGRCLSAGELRALFEVCADAAPAGRRDGAIIALLYGAGLRRSELVGLDLADYNCGDGSLRVRGKGSKERIAYAPEGAMHAVEAWIMLRGHADGPLFVPVGKGGAIKRGRRMTAQSVYGILRKRGEQARLASFSPHDLRRTFVGDLLDAGADVSLVQQLAGHSHVTTTQKYDRRPEQAKQRAATLIHVPIVKRNS